MFTMLGPFFENSPALTELFINDCQFGNDGWRLLALAIGSSKNKSLQKVTLLECNVSDEGLVDIITSLSMHSNIERLDLDDNRFSTNGCTALSTLLRCSATQLKYLNLSNNEINDEGIGALALGLKNCSHLETLKLENNTSVTTKGWQKLASILDAPNSNLIGVGLMINNINDDALAAFANALVNNNTLTTLSIIDMPTANTESAFSKLLCDTSGINLTFLSNHTLTSLGLLKYTHPLQQLLDLNVGDDKKEVAMIKILKHHHDFDLTPFFEWEFKVLPLIIDWFERASLVTMPVGFEPNIEPRKLSSIYQFVRGMPLDYVEVRLKKELEDIKAEELRKEQELAKLAERKRSIIDRLGRR